MEVHESFIGLGVIAKFLICKPLMIVWFQLVESNGAPFNGTTATSVSLSDDANIAVLRDAVKAKCNTPRLLKDTSTAELKVYANVAAFNNGGAPLPLDGGVAGVGETLADAVAVVVPSGEDTAPTSIIRSKVFIHYLC